jgi:hypothetical protein
MCIWPGCLFGEPEKNAIPLISMHIFLAGKHRIGVDVQAESIAVVVAEGGDGGQSLGDS